MGNPSVFYFIKEKKKDLPVFHFGSPHHISLYNPLNSDKYASIVNKKYRCGKINKKEPLTINEKVRRIFIIRFVIKKAKLLNLKFVKQNRN